MPANPDREVNVTVYDFAGHAVGERFFEQSVAAPPQNNRIEVTASAFEEDILDRSKALGNEPSGNIFRGETPFCEILQAGVQGQLTFFPVDSGLFAVHLMLNGVSMGTHGLMAGSDIEQGQLGLSSVSEKRGGEANSTEQIQIITDGE